MDESAVSIALAVLRLALGLILMTHGANKLVGAGGISGTALWFEGLGLRPGIVHAWVAAVSELGCGFLMAVGLLFPAACAGFLGLMTVAALTDHRGKGFFVFNGGWEYVAMVAVAATALGVSGPGRLSIDHLLGAQLQGLRWGSACLLVGLLAGTGMVLTFRRSSISKES